MRHPERGVMYDTHPKLRMTPSHDDRNRTSSSAMGEEGGRRADAGQRKVARGDAFRGLAAQWQIA